MRLRRVPFTPVAVDDVVAFCVRHPLSEFDETLLRRFVLTLTSHPDGVLLFGDDDDDDGGGGLALAAVVIDVADSGTGTASFELLGGRAPVAAEVFADLVLPAAIAFARRVGRAGLQLGLPVAVPGADAALAALGFVPVHDSCVLRRRAAAAPPAAPPLPTGWRWAPLDAGLVAPLHAALTEAFLGSTTMNLSPLELFGRVALSGVVRPGWLVLLDQEARVAGMIQLVLHDGARRSIGELRTLGRAPRLRGQGVGPRLMVEALRVLMAGGAREVELATEVQNDRALRLYQRFGFEIVSRTPWYRLALSSS